VGDNLALITVTDANWGDSIYLRLFGMQELTLRDPKIDKFDFRILLKQAKACRQRDEEIKFDTSGHTLKSLCAFGTRKRHA
jgi:hypothetical protein